MNRKKAWDNAQAFFCFFILSTLIFVSPDV